MRPSCLKLRECHQCGFHGIPWHGSLHPGVEEKQHFSHCGSACGSVPRFAHPEMYCFMALQPLCLPSHWYLLGWGSVRDYTVGSFACRKTPLAFNLSCPGAWHFNPSESSFHNEPATDSPCQLQAGSYGRDTARVNALGSQEIWKPELGRAASGRELTRRWHWDGFRVLTGEADSFSQQFAWSLMCTYTVCMGVSFRRNNRTSLLHSFVELEGAGGSWSIV